jgi:TatD DNase family protein
MIIDTHSHLNFAAYKKDSEEVIKRSLSYGIWMVNIGTKYKTSKRAVEIAKLYSEGVYAAIGLHPLYTAARMKEIKTDEEDGNFLAKGESFNSKDYKQLASSEKVVAIGEVGLDYYYGAEDPLLKKNQEKELVRQLDLAEELSLPVIFHCRKAHDDLIEILRKRSLRGVVHCFTGSWKQAKEYLEMGLYLGFNGIIFKLNLDKIIKKMPLDRILVETDCPYLTPPMADKQRNEPFFITHVLDKISDIKKKDVKEDTTRNARALFRI